MRSTRTSTPTRETTVTDDRTAKARIRDAAIGLFAEDGVDATPIRAIAETAAVSPGLVIHHYGSKDGLRAACDEHVAALIREQKQEAMAAGPGLDLVGALREASHGPPLTRYLARTLVDGSPHVTELVDEMVDDALDYMAAGVESGTLQQTDHPYGRTALLVMWSLGALVLHDHVERLLDVDLTTQPDDPSHWAPYLDPALEVLGDGVLTATARERMGADLAAEPDGADRPEETEP